MLQAAHSFAEQGKRVLFFTLEMTLRTCILRLMNNYCSIDNWVNISGISPEEHAIVEKKISEFRDHLDKLDLVFIEGHGKTFKEINDIVKKTVEPVDAVFIDYIQMIANNDRDGIDEYIKDLRTLAIKQNFCAIIGSQINRGTFDNSKITFPEVHHLKSSGALEEIADRIFLCHWAFHYSREEEEYNNYWLRLAKNREGRTGVFDCKFEPEFCRICEWPEKTIEEKYEANNREGKHRVQRIPYGDD
jgi:replicative DNA helicase